MGTTAAAPAATEHPYPVIGIENTEATMSGSTSHKHPIRTAEQAADAILALINSRPHSPRRDAASLLAPRA
jgi:hypothetical protein